MARYEIIRHEKQPYWFSGCPVFLDAHAITRDNLNGSMLAQCKFKNMSGRIVTAMDIKLFCFTADHAGLPGVEKFSLLNLQAGQYDLFGGNQAVPLPDSATRIISIQPLRIVFGQGEIWENQDLTRFFVPLDTSQDLISLPDDFAGQYERDLAKAGIHKSHLFWPKVADQYWLCGCGAYLSPDNPVCHACGAHLPALLSLHEPQGLQERLSRYRIEKERQDQARKKRRFALIAGAALVLAIAIGAASLLAKEEPVESTADMYDRLCESVVLLEIYDEQYELIAMGSGFFIMDDQTIATNYHVINGARYIAAYSNAGDYYDVAYVLAYNQDPDLAIVGCSVPTGQAPLALADSGEINRGDDIFAIGSPLGLQNTISDGIVSAMWEDGGTQYIQITAPISPGSSGGALFNARGEVIGVTSSSFVEGQNINFAISANNLKNLIGDIDSPVPLRELPAAGYPLAGTAQTEGAGSGEDSGDGDGPDSQPSGSAGGSGNHGKDSGNASASGGAGSGGNSTANIPTSNSQLQDVTIASVSGETSGEIVWTPNKYANRYCVAIWITDNSYSDDEYQEFYYAPGECTYGDYCKIAYSGLHSGTGYAVDVAAQYVLPAAAGAEGAYDSLEGYKYYSGAGTKYTFTTPGEGPSNAAAAKDYTISVSPADLSFAVGETITVTITHNDEYASVFLSAIDFGTARYTQGYSWKYGYTEFELTGTEPGYQLIQFYYTASSGEVIKSDVMTLTVY